MQTTDINEPVRQEMQRFRQALPELLKGEHAGKWVVFKDGKVRSAHDNSRDAYRAGVKEFAVFGGQVIVQVVEEKPRYINAGVELFGHS